MGDVRGSQGAATGSTKERGVQRKLTLVVSLLLGAQGSSSLGRLSQLELSDLGLKRRIGTPSG